MFGKSSIHGWIYGKYKMNIEKWMSEKHGRHFR